MAKDKLVDYDSTASGNLDVGGISVAEGMLPSNVNNAIREQMSHLKDFADGTEAINALAVDNLKMDGNTISSTDTNGNITLAPNGTGVVALSSTDLTFGDNDKIRLGDSDDLQLYHDGTKSVIADVTGAGNFHIRGSNVLYIQSDDGGENYAVFNDNGSASLYYDNAAKIATTATGVDVTGTVTADRLDIDYGVASSAAAVIDHTDTANGNGVLITAGGSNSGKYVLHGRDGSGNSRFYVSSNGNVGIGTSSPSEQLNIKDNICLGVDGTATSAAKIIRSSDTNVIFGGDPGADLVLQSGRGTGVYGSSLIFKTPEPSNVASTFGTQTERLRIDSGGGISKNGSFSYSGTSDDFYWNTGSGDRFRFHSGTTSSRDLLGFSNPNGVVGAIETSGTSTSYNTSSDYRLKENVVADWDATTRLKQLNPVRFNFIADADTTVDGFLAHEVQSVVPEAITGTHNGMRDEEYEVSAATGDIYTPAIDAVLDENGNEVTPAVAEVIHSTDVELPEELAEGQQWRETTAAVMGTRSVPDYQGIDQSKLVPLLVKTIQELESRITALEAN